MGIFLNMIEFITTNKEWFLSGIGVFILNQLFFVFKKKKSAANIEQKAGSQNIQIAGNVDGNVKLSIFESDKKSKRKITFRIVILGITVFLIETTIGAFFLNKTIFQHELKNEPIIIINNQEEDDTTQIKNVPIERNPKKDKFPKNSSEEKKLSVDHKGESIITATKNETNNTYKKEDLFFSKMKNDKTEPTKNYNVRSRPKIFYLEDFKDCLVDAGKVSCPLKDFENQFVDNGDQTISDYSTGLMWQKNQSPEIRTGIAELFVNHINKNKFAGRGDWRLPTLDELKTLIEKDSSNGFYISDKFKLNDPYCCTSDLFSEKNILQGEDHSIYKNDTSLHKLTINFKNPSIMFAGHTYKIILSIGAKYNSLAYANVLLVRNIK